MKAVNDVLNSIQQKYPQEKEFYQAVSDVLEDVAPYIDGDSDIQNHNILQRMAEPDRIIQFRVTWQNQKGEIEVNRGWRVQHNNALGAYKGGLRFHPDVTVDTFKFLAFEQTFKNALTGLPMGGGKGGSDFNSKGRSNADIFSFCQAFMLELFKYLGPMVDVPAGDIGVGAREIGYMFGTYKKLTDRFDGVLTGKGPAFGGSLIRKEATGYGCVYFLEEAVKRTGDTLDNKTCVVSGAGNVALYTVEKLLQKKAKVITMSDSKGMIHVKNGITPEQLKNLIQIKEVEHGTLEQFHAKFAGCDYYAGKEPWALACDVAIPCATQNEIDEKEARTLKENKTRWVCEAANMPLTSKATEILAKAGVVVLPSKAANAGGVSVSGLERTQNALFLSWSAEEVDKQLHAIMKDIHDQCVENSMVKNEINYIQGANIAGFKRVAKAMMAYGAL